MLKIIGDFTEPSQDKKIESLMLNFMPSSIPLQQRWRNNGLSADFLADYVTTFFPKVADNPESGTRQNEIKGAVNYIANELLENAMKYSNEQLPYPILIHLQLEPDHIAINATNSVDAEQSIAFLAFIERLEESDPGLMFVEQMEASAAGGTTSGLGILTMINDYAARLAWKFQHLPDGAVTITTQVQLAI